MTRHRTITGFVAVALLAVAATAATVRSHAPWTDGIVVSPGTTMLKDLTVDANELPPRALTSAGPRYHLRQRIRLSDRLDARQVSPQSAYLAKFIMDL